MFVEHNDRYYPETYDERERDRDLSSISNSSKGSNNRRSQDSPEEREIGGKRRRIDGSKVCTFTAVPRTSSLRINIKFDRFNDILHDLFILVHFINFQKNNDDGIINVDDGGKRERSSNKSSKEKRDKSSYDDIEPRKSRVTRKRNL